VQTLTDSAVAIAASYAAKAFGIKTGTLVREARRLCPAVIAVQANHRLYSEYHKRILKAVDTCVPVEKVCSIDEMACKLMGTERQVPVARELALKVKRALREQVAECLTCSIGIAPNVFLDKVGSDLQKPDGLVVITKDDLPDILLRLEDLRVCHVVPRELPCLRAQGRHCERGAAAGAPRLHASDGARAAAALPKMWSAGQGLARCGISAARLNSKMEKHGGGVRRRADRKA
jgi:DNA polymerase-4